MSFYPSASKLELAFKCHFAWSHHAPRWPRRTDSSYAKFGTAVHHVAELIVRNEHWDAAHVARVYELPLADADRLVIVSRHLQERLSRGTYDWRQPEIALAYNIHTDTGRVLYQSRRRDYANQFDGDFCGTLDLVDSTRDMLFVRDFKTGERSKLRPAKDDKQIRFQALAAARAFGADEVTAELVHVSEDGIAEGKHLRHVFDAFELDSIADELKQLANKLDEPAVPRPGAYCDDLYCPLVAVCPATLAALAAVDSASSLQFPFTPEITSHEHAAHTRIRLEMVKECVKQVDAALRFWVDENGPVPIRDGVAYGRREQTREAIDLSRPGALKAVIDALGRKATDGAMKITITKTDIKRWAPDKATERALLDELRSLGAVKQSKFTKYEEFKLASSEEREEEEA